MRSPRVPQSISDAPTVAGAGRLMRLGVIADAQPLADGVFYVADYVGSGEARGWRYTVETIGGGALVVTVAAPGTPGERWLVSSADLAEALIATLQAARGRG